MIDYENLIVERDRPDYPTGLKHYKKDTVAENSLFDIDLMTYKAVGIVKGQDNEKDTDGRETESSSASEEVRRRNLTGIPKQMMEQTEKSKDDISKLMKENKKNVKQAQASAKRKLKRRRTKIEDNIIFC